jgi:hypothetical protein
VSGAERRRGREIFLFFSCEILRFWDRDEEEKGKAAVVYAAWGWVPCRDSGASRKFGFTLSKQGKELVYESFFLFLQKCTSTKSHGH